MLIFSGPTQKLRRPHVMKMYKETIDAFYSGWINFKFFCSTISSFSFTNVQFFHNFLRFLFIFFVFVRVKLFIRFINSTIPTFRPSTKATHSTFFLQIKIKWLLLKHNFLLEFELTFKDSLLLQNSMNFWILEHTFSNKNRVFIESFRSCNREIWRFLPWNLWVSFSL